MVLQSDPPASAEIETVGKGQRPAETAARVEIPTDAEVSLAIGEQGFQLRIAVQAFCHIAHFRPRSTN